jgi:hypothetical protein
MYASVDGGATFTAIQSQGLPDITADAPRSREAMWPLIATPGREGDLWYVSPSGLYHSADGGASFTKLDHAPAIIALSFGKEPLGRDFPAMFSIGTHDEVKAVWRSDDAGASWIRINDDDHQWGTRFRCIAGDPRIFGQVYVGTDGRGIFVGAPANIEATSAP